MIMQLSMLIFIPILFCRLSKKVNCLDVRYKYLVSTVRSSIINSNNTLDEQCSKSSYRHNVVLGITRYLGTAILPTAILDRDPLHHGSLAWTPTIAI